MLLRPREQLNKLSCVVYTADVNIEVLARGTAGFSGKKLMFVLAQYAALFLYARGRSDAFGKFT